MASPLFSLFGILLAFFATYRLAYRRLAAVAIADGDRLWRTGRGSRRAERALLAAAVRTRSSAVHVRVLADWETQALTIAGSAGDRVLVSSGAIATLPSAQLMALIAHELGHVAHRHIEHELRDRASRLAALGAAAVLLAFEPLLGVVSVVVVAVVGELLLQAELRRHEREADAFARRCGVGAALAQALELADRRDQALIELTILLAATQRRRDPLVKAIVRPIERAWGGAAPDRATLDRWVSSLRRVAGPVQVPRRRHRYDGLREIHEPVAIRARRLRTAAHG